MISQEELQMARDNCGWWDEDTDNCDDEFPVECPYHEVCKKDTEGD